MGLTTPVPPPVDPATFMQMPYRERLKTLSRFWAEYGFGTPKLLPMIYVVKVVFFYALGAVLVSTLTSDLNPLHPKAWWDEPIIWQKIVVWTMMLELIGVAGTWGPLAGHFKPMTGGILYWARRGTIRLPPWPDKVPFTKGDERTTFDVALYLAIIACMIVALALPGSDDAELDRLIGPNKGLMPPGIIIPIIVGMGILGLRDKLTFLAARSEQWIPPLIFFAFYPFVDMIVAAKLTIVIIWFGAGFSKLNKHFEMVIPPMVSNTPWMLSKRIRLLLYRKFPDDLRPSHTSKLVTHAGGAIGELLPPLVLLFSHNWTVTVIAAVFMICYHAFITSTFPLAVPLEWNVAFMFTTAFLFLGYPNHEGYGLGDMDTGLLILTLAGLLFFPFLGERRPDLVSFLPALRQYSGNWASAMWALAPGAEEKLDERIKKAAKLQKGQLTEMFDADTAEVTLHQLLGWRSLHSQGRGLNSVMMRHLGDDIDVYTPREAEFMCNALVGWNFGDGHLHSQFMLEAIQRRCQFEPGEFTVVWVESEPILDGRQQYFVWDAGVGVVERGSWAVKDAVEEQPWLPNGPIPVQVDWRLEGYERVSHGASRVTAGTA
jgi:transmembrane protein DUF3556